MIAPAKSGWRAKKEQKPAVSLTNALNNFNKSWEKLLKCWHYSEDVLRTESQFNYWYFCPIPCLVVNDKPADWSVYNEDVKSVFKVLLFHVWHEHPWADETSLGWTWQNSTNTWHIKKEEKQSFDIHLNPF